MQRLGRMFDAHYDVDDVVAVVLDVAAPLPCDDSERGGNLDKGAPPQTIVF